MFIDIKIYKIFFILVLQMDNESNCLICSSIRFKCSICKLIYCKSCSSVDMYKCSICDNLYCDNCKIICGVNKSNTYSAFPYIETSNSHLTCNNCMIKCEKCGDFVCNKYSCFKQCIKCTKELCDNCSMDCSSCGTYSRLTECNHRQMDYNLHSNGKSIDHSDTTICNDCLNQCPTCKRYYCKVCM